MTYCNLTHKVYRRLIEMMENCEIAPGQRLVFVDLARQFEVSRTPVNNALHLLEREAYLDFIPHQGYTMHSFTAKEIADLRAVQETLEMYGIAEVICHQSGAGRASLNLVMKEYEQTTSGRTDHRLLLFDVRFHQAILGLAGNTVLIDEYRHIGRKLFLDSSNSNLAAELVRAIQGEHEALCRAVYDKNIAEARRLLQGRQRFLAKWQKNGSGKPGFRRPSASSIPPPAWRKNHPAGP